MRCLDNTFGCLIELLVKMVIDFDSALLMSYDWYNAVVVIYTNKNLILLNIHV